MWNDLELGWFAGIMEGEGCFYRIKKKRRMYPCLELQITDRDTAERAAYLLGVSVVKRSFAPNRKQVWRVRAAHARARAAMEMLFPLMSARRQEQILLAL